MDEKELPLITCKNDGSNVITPLNVGLIGCGRAAERLYVPALSNLTEARLVAVADPIRKRREIVSSKIFGCLTFSTAEALFQKAKIAAVIITTPPDTHVAITTLALQSGIPALIEKPLSPSMAGIKKLELLISSSGGSVMIGFNRRHWKPVQKMRLTMHNRQLSDRVSAQLVMTTNVQAWSPICGVSDPLDDLGSHQLDLLRYVFDREILAISAGWIDKHTIKMKVRLSGGIVVADCIAAHTNRHQEYIFIKCEHGKYQIQKGSERIKPAAGLIRQVLDSSDVLRRRLLGKRSLLSGSYEKQLISFFNYVRTGEVMQPSIADGIAVIKAVEATRKSASKGGKEVSI